MKDKSLLDSNQNCQDKSLLGEQSSSGISEGLQELINAVAEEVVFQGTSYDSQKALLKRSAEAEDVDYGKLEKSLKGFFKVMSDYESKGDDALLGKAATFSKDCGFTDDFIEKLVVGLNHKKAEAQAQAAKEALKKEKAKQERERRAAEEEKKKLQDQLKKTEEEANAKAKAADEALKKEKAKQESERKAAEEEKRKIEAQLKKTEEEAEAKAKAAEEALKKEKAKQESERKAAEEEKKKLEGQLKKSEEKAKAEAKAAEEALKKEKAKLAAEKAKQEEEKKRRTGRTILLVVLLTIAIGVWLCVRSCGGDKKVEETPVTVAPVETPAQTPAVETPVVETPKVEEPAPKVDKPATTTTTTTTKPQTQKPSQPSSVDWNGVASYSGPTDGGQPHGMGGTLKFNKDYQLDLRDGNGTKLDILAGETIENAKFDKGNLHQGELHRKDGTRKWFNR